MKVENMLWNEVVTRGDFQLGSLRTSEEWAAQALLPPPEFPSDLPDYQRWKALFDTAVRTAAIYALEGDDSLDEMLISAKEMPTPYMLPSLPFRRMWIEMYSGERRRGIPIGESGDMIVAFVVYEVQRQREWLTLGVGVETQVTPDGRNRGWDGTAVNFMPMSIVPAESRFLFSHSGKAEMVDDEVAPMLLTLVHLLTAKNSAIHLAVSDRAERRRFQRAHNSNIFPTVYVVPLSQAGEHANEPSDRVYRCRWLVSGHWRHVHWGDELCTCCSSPRTAKFIQAYVKGPPGAPWKGRAIHRLDSED